MVKEKIKKNAADIAQEISWLEKWIELRLQAYFDDSQTLVVEQQIAALSPPVFAEPYSDFAEIILLNQLTQVERAAFTLALIPHLKPHLLDVLFIKNPSTDRAFTEFGGVKGAHHNGFLPTVATLAFLLGGTSQGFDIFQIFSPDSPLIKKGLLNLSKPVNDEPILSTFLNVSPDLFEFLTTGQTQRPNFDTSFPAKFIESKQDWEDLVLNDITRDHLEEMETWILHGQTLMRDWGMSKKLRPGYRALFYGPPGTGKTTTACLLGRMSGRDVYKVDLSMIVSKYIGETEKNLAKVFDKAENKQWILFFDEADALFGKRTDVSSSHDRHANQEVAYLLQRIEDFNGIIILASNMKQNLDEAFLRRFESIIYFPVPKPKERLLLWRKAFSAESELAPDVQLSMIAEHYELSGGSIMNVVRFASLRALKRGSREILHAELLEGVRRELAKEGKSVH